MRLYPLRRDTLYSYIINIGKNEPNNYSGRGVFVESWLLCSTDNHALRIFLELKFEYWYS